MATSATETQMLVCHQCGSINRVLAGRDLTQGACGRCKAPLATDAPVDIDGAMLARLRTRDTGAFVIDVWAPWCGPCRIMAPSYSKAASRLSSRIRLFKLDSDAHQAAASGLGLRGVPTLIAFAGGKQIAHQAGAQSGDALTGWIQSLFASKGIVT
jgi:thioredoxin 2